MFARILVPLDESVLATRALAYAQRLAPVSGAKITLLEANDRVMEGLSSESPERLSRTRYGPISRASRPASRQMAWTLDLEVDSDGAPAAILNAVNSLRA